MPHPTPRSSDSNSASTGAEGLLESWKEIAGYLHRDERTVKRWERQRGLPVRRIQGGKRGRVFAIRSELDAWRYQSPPSADQPDGIPAIQPGRRQALQWLAGAVAIGVLAGIPAWLLITRLPNPPLRFTPLANLPGDEVDPAFSPAGNFVAFAYHPEGASNLDLFVDTVGGGGAVQLTRTPEDERYPQWSPDSSQIAFVRRSGSSTSIWVTGSTGAGERRVSDLHWSRSDGDTTLAWTQGGEDLIFPDRESDEDPLSLYSLRLSTGVRTRLSFPPFGSVGDSSPVFSPDGESLAFTRQNPSRVSDIWLMGRSGGKPRKVTSDQRQISGLAWSKDGKSLVFLSDRGGPDPAIWRVALAGGAPQSVIVLPSHSRMMALDARHGRLAYTRFLVKSSIWRYDLLSGSASPPPPLRLISSGSIQAHPQYSPDGRAIAFMSDRSGYMEIWVCRADGSRPRRLTSLRGEGGMPNWSPDGKWIAFDMRVSGNQGIFLVGADGGPAVPLLLDPFENGAPSWSADGQWIYFTSKRSGNHEVWKMRNDGKLLSQVTRDGGGISAEAPGGHFLYYSKLSKQPGIFKKPLPDGDEICVLPDLVRAYLGYWHLGRDGVFFLDVVDRSASKQPVLKLLPHGSGKPRVVADLDAATYPAGYSGGLITWRPLSVSPDQRFLLVTGLDLRQSNIMIAEGFK